MFEPVQIAVITIATLSIYSYRADFSRYSVFTVGVFKRLERTVVEGAEYECAEFHCEETTEVSERRQYFKEIVALGMPIVRYHKGESHYCKDHVSFEVIEDLDNPKISTSEKIGTSLLMAFAAFIEWLAKGEPEVEESEFDDITASVETALDLIPVIFIVLLAAIVLNLMQWAIPNGPEADTEFDRVHSSFMALLIWAGIIGTITTLVLFIT